MRRKNNVASKAERRAKNKAYGGLSEFQKEEVKAIQRILLKAGVSPLDASSGAIFLYDEGYRKLVTTPKKDKVEPEEYMPSALAMEGPDQFKEVKYKPTCCYGCDDCILDPAYIKASYPSWYKELYGDKSVEEAAKSGDCSRCIDASMYDDEDK